MIDHNNSRNSDDHGRSNRVLPAGKALPPKGEGEMPQHADATAAGHSTSESGTVLIFVPEDFLKTGQSLEPSMAQIVTDPFASDYTPTTSVMTEVTEPQHGETSSTNIDVPCPRKVAHAAVCVITDAIAQEIFQAGQGRPKGRKAKVASHLGERFGISAKAVRDIWRLRTWTRATYSYWTPEDKQLYLKRRLCTTCHNADLTALNQACASCRKALE